MSELNVEEEIYLKANNIAIPMDKLEMHHYYVASLIREHNLKGFVPYTRNTRQGEYDMNFEQYLIRNNNIEEMVDKIASILREASSSKIKFSHGNLQAKNILIKDNEPYLDDFRYSSVTYNYEEHGKYTENDLETLYKSMELIRCSH